MFNKIPKRNVFKYVLWSHDSTLTAPSTITRHLLLLTLRWHRKLFGHGCCHWKIRQHWDGELGHDWLWCHWRYHLHECHVQGQWHLGLCLWQGRHGRRHGRHGRRHGRHGRRHGRHGRRHRRHGRRHGRHGRRHGRHGRRQGRLFGHG